MKYFFLNLTFQIRGLKSEKYTQKLIKLVSFSETSKRLLNEICIELCKKQFIKNREYSRILKKGLPKVKFAFQKYSFYTTSSVSFDKLRSRSNFNKCH